MRDLKDFIHSKGGNVVAVSTLTSHDPDNRIIAISDKTLNKLEAYGDKLYETLKYYGAADSLRGLTEGEGKQILSYLNRERKAGTYSQSGKGQSRDRRVDSTGVLDNTESNNLFKKENPFLLFQIIGELGATNLDRIEEVTTRMDNKKIAEEMLEAGKNEKAVRLATGWEKGADGKYRYEISDGQILDNWEQDTTKDGQDYKYSTLSQIFDNEELYKAYPELKNINVYISPMEGLLRGQYSPSIGITLNEDLFNGPIPGIYESIKEMEAQPEYLEYSKNFDDIMNNAGEDYVKLEKDLDKLKNDFDNTDFGKKYNELLNKPRYGFHITEAGRSTLIHEIQHAIQYIEDFAKGGNENSARRQALDTTRYTIGDKQKSNWYTYYLREESAADFALQRKRILKNPELIKKTGYWQGHSWAVPKKGTQDYFNYLWNRVNGWIQETEEAIARNDGYESILKSLYDKSDEELKKLKRHNKYMSDKYKDLYFRIYNLEEKAKEYNKMDPYELYHRLAGEVESRNVQARMNLNEEERRNTLLRDTADVIPSQQIVYFQTLKALDKTIESDTMSFQTELDKEYSDAVNNGDITKAKELLLEEAIKKGYAAPGDYKDAHVAPAASVEKEDFTNLEALQEMNDESYDVNLYAIANGIMNVPEDFFSHPERFGYGDTVSRQAAAAINSAIRAVKSGNLQNATVTVYRAVPNEIKEGQLQSNGQWVSPAKQYAINHGDARFGEGNYRIIEQEVSATELWFDFNDIKEWGYDDGTTDNVYKNVVNNRKSLQITYDENGNLIPLSQRFDENNPSILFQTQQELYNDARSFATWQEFMDHYQNDFDPAALEDPTYHNQVPSDAGAQWYQTTWELANGIQPEESLNEEEVKDKYAKEGTEPRAIDSLFVAEITGENGKFEDFMHMVAYYENIDLNAPEWTQVADEQEAAERDRIEQIKDLIEVTMASESMQRAINRIAAGGEITPGFKTRLISELSDPFKSRDFRALYAEVMDDPTYRVNPEDTTATLLENKLNNVNRRFNLQIPAVDVSRMSPQQRKELSDKLDNEEIAAKLKDGSLKMDDQVDKYIKSLTSQINELKRQQNELKKSILEETSRLADEEQKDLLRVNEELIKAKAAYDKKNDEITRKIAKGIKISSKYQKEAQNLKHDYNEILRKYKDLLATTKITGEVQRALDTQQRLGDALNNIDKLEEERTTMADVQKLRKNLVKKTMRRVKFDTVDYENARKIIAIQRIFEPNLLGGVNKWIGQRDPYLRGVISAVITDKDYRNELSNYIRDRATSSNAYSEFWAKWQDLITSPTTEEALKKFNAWDEKTRKRAIMYLPKEDWIKELQLKELEKEREESIDLDIGIKERREPMRNEKGELIYKPQYDENGKLIKNPDRQEAYYKTIYEFDASEEIKAMIRDAVGEDIYNNLLYRPFSEWTVEEMESLAKRIDDLYTEGRDILAARKQLQIERAAAIRQKIEKAVKDTGIVINDDDTPEEKAKKQAKIDKILGLNSELKGTNASKETGFKSRMNRLLHGYVDANILRVARILDGNTEGVNVQELYRKEDDCYNNKTRSINGRVNKINKVMQENNITMDELAQQVKVGDKTFTIDELLFFAAANEDYVEDPKKMAKGLMGIAANDDYAATSRNAVMFGNLFSDTASTEFKEECAREDEEMQRRIDADELTAEERNAQILGELVTRPGTARYIQRCHEAFVDIIAAANQLDDKYKALLKVIADDYAAQYDRMNEISIKEFNTPVHRVKCYVPLVRLESNGDTNVNQVKEDLLAALGQGASKEWVNKGMTKRRTNMSPLHQKPVQTGLYKTWADSVDRTEHFISYSGYVRELNRVYKSRDAQYTRQFIENRYGKGMITYIDDYINEVANPNANKIREKGAELLHTLRGKLHQLTLHGKLVQSLNRDLLHLGHLCSL